MVNHPQQSYVQMPNGIRSPTVAVHVHALHFSQYTFKHYGSHIWNLLPNEIKSCTEIDKFKSLLKSWGSSKC